jgi:long-chain acyl-CoA synthetase
VPAEIDVNEFKSIGQLFERSVKQVSRSRRLHQHGQVDHLRRAGRPYARLAKGARVALMMPNLLQDPVCMYGILRAGFTVVNCNPLYTPRELEHQLKDSGAEAIVIVENFASVLQEVHRQDAGQARHRHQPGRHARLPQGRPGQFRRQAREEDGAGLESAGVGALQRRAGARRAARLQAGEVGHEDIAFLQYTGGTTGVSKGAMLTHRNIIANVHAGLQPGSSRWCPRARVHRHRACRCITSSR